MRGPTSVPRAARAAGERRRAHDDVRRAGPGTGPPADRGMAARPRRTDRGLRLRHHRSVDDRPAARRAGRLRRQHVLRGAGPASGPAPLRAPRRSADPAAGDAADRDRPGAAAPPGPHLRADTPAEDRRGGQRPAGVDGDRGGGLHSDPAGAARSPHPPALHLSDDGGRAGAADGAGLLRRRHVRRQALDPARAAVTPARRVREDHDLGVLRGLSHRQPRRAGAGRTPRPGRPAAPGGSSRRSSRSG